MELPKPTQNMMLLYYVGFYLSSVVLGFLLWSAIGDEDKKYKRFALAFAIIGIVNPLVSWVNVLLYVGYTIRFAAC